MKHKRMPLKGMKIISVGKSTAEVNMDTALSRIQVFKDLELDKETLVECVKYVARTQNMSEEHLLSSVRLQ